MGVDWYKKAYSRLATNLPSDETPLYSYNSNKEAFPRSREYSIKCIMIVEWWLHIHG
jgi:hypothetical protein